MKFGLNGLVIPILSLLVIFVLISPGNAEALDTIDFESLSNKQIVDNEFAGLTISANNIGGGPDLAVIFDSQVVQGGDPDLNGPLLFDWDIGNLSPNTPLGNLLIIQETSCNGQCNDFIDVDPDDEGSRPAGELIFDFDSSICKFGLDIVDIEGPDEFGNDSGFAAAFFMGGSELLRVGFDDLITNNGNPFFDPSIEFGDNSANTVTPFTAGIMGLTGFDEVKINLGGSGAVDNIKFEECELVGGHGGPIDKTALMVTGAQLNASWMIPVLISAVGIGVFVVTRK